jgi:hypothetical protein
MVRSPKRHGPYGRKGICPDSFSGPRGRPKRRPRNMAIDSGTIARSGDGSTAPSGTLDGSRPRQVGEQFSSAAQNSLSPPRPCSPGF